LLIPLNDAAQFTTALDLLLHDTELRKRLAKSATEVVEQYSDTRFYRCWDELISTVVSH
jgi:glycosyltransferase involved in cell wall biosynthesis